MISAEATPYENCLRVVFIFPGDRSKEIFIPGNNAGALVSEAKRRLYIELRQFTLGKLTSWLNQRLKAYEHTGHQAKAVKAAQLIMLISYYQNRSYFRLCDFVADHRAALEDLAPSERSPRCYSYYSSDILPVLIFCSGMKGAAA